MRRDFLVEKSKIFVAFLNISHVNVGEGFIAHIKTNFLTAQG